MTPKDSIIGIKPLAMIVHDLDLVGVTIVPDEAHAPLIIDPDTVLPPSVAPERLETIAGRCPQIVQRPRVVQLQELPIADPQHVLRYSLDEASFPGGTRGLGTWGSRCPPRRSPPLRRQAASSACSGGV